jgi:integrase
VKHRKKVLATIYQKSKSYPFYRVVYYLDGRRHMKSFAAYGGKDGAKSWSEAKVRELHSGSRVAALTPQQANDALAALDRLQRHYQETGKRFSMLVTVSGYCDLLVRLNGRNPTEAVDGYLNTIATVKRIEVGKAVEEFITHRQQKTIAPEGKRPGLSPEHHYNTSLWLREFAKTLPGHCVCDLTKDLVNTYIAGQADSAPKTRNEKRGVVKMLFGWCVERDYLSPHHRLLEANGLKHEPDDPAEIECYTATELWKMLDRASRVPNSEAKEPEADHRALLPVVALAGLGGLRFKEITRLSWDDVWRIPDHIEIKAFKSKTRSRRLVTICDALGQWLEEHRESKGQVWTKGYDMLHEDFAELRSQLKVAERRNGLRHSFISAHFAAHCDENLTAAIAGNSPAVIHKHYKGLMPKQEGDAWFAVIPHRKP